MPVEKSCNIDVNAISYSIGESVLINDISLQSSHRRIGVIGRNGSGKSTLARLLCGLIEPSTGSIHIDGVDVAHDRHKAIRTVGMLFQNPDHQIIFPTVEEELQFGLNQLGLKKEQARQAVVESLQQFGIQDWGKKSVSTLSQGQRHLVCYPMLDWIFQPLCNSLDI